MWSMAILKIALLLLKINHGVLQRRFAVLVVADADGFIDSGHEDFAVSDFAGSGCADDGLNGLVLDLVGDNDFDLYFGQQIDGVFAAAVELSVALLAAMAAGFQNCHAFNAGFEEGILHGIQLGGLEDCLNLLHKKNNLAREVSR